MFREIVLASVTCTSLMGGAQAATLVTWDAVNGSSVAPSFELNTINAYSLSRGPGITQRAGSTFNSNNWTEGGDLATAFSNDDFVDFGFETTTLAFDLDELRIRVDRSPTGPSDFAILAFANGSKTGVNVLETPLSASGRNFTVDLSAFTAVTEIFFALVGWGATSPLGTLDIETVSSQSFGIRLTGSISPVPLPAGAALMPAGLALFGFAYRRRRQR